MFKATTVRSNYKFPAAEQKRQLDSQASHGDLVFGLNTKCDRVVNSTNNRCAKVKSLGSRATGKIYSKIQTQISPT